MSSNIERFSNTVQDGMTGVETLLRRERVIVACGLFLITALAWGWVIVGAGTGMPATIMTTWHFPPPSSPNMVQPWSLGYAAVMFSMWWIMMIAMMTPSAAPMIMLYARAYRHEQKLGKLEISVTPTFSFAAGYLIAWLLFSAVAVGLQWSLERAGMIHAMLMWSLSPVFSAALLIAAGIYQLSPLKNVCLRHCRSPASFIAEHFRPGSLGAFQMGFKHGLFCLGCCWFLMALLFAGGIMNLFWIAGLALFVLIEKVAPQGHKIAHIAGIAMIVIGSSIVLRLFF